MSSEPTERDPAAAPPAAPPVLGYRLPARRGRPWKFLVLGMAVAWQGFLVTVFSTVGGGWTETVILIASAAFWLGVALILLRRGRRWTTFDLFYVALGLPVLVLTALVATVLAKPSLL